MNVASKHSDPDVRKPLALWIGPEPTVNRVGERYFDQLELSGFAHRLDDLDRLASLGAERVRFPVIWERTAPGPDGACDWRWLDSRLQRLRELKLGPIAGLLHHGSGPRHTSLVDPALPQLLARYALQVARRYPWLEDFTPVNEPLTTARFSGLYGHWYPHGCDDRSFVRALLQQVHATVASMAAIRGVIPHARLVQTEDMGHVLATKRLQYQADFENERRWLSFDLLCGRVDRHHPLWYYLTHHGASAEELDRLLDEPCPPDIVGVNAYITSERFLDHRFDRYPAVFHGGNGRDAYADIESVRVHPESMGGFLARLREAHARYRLPLAITEAHLGCTREEQLRWLRFAWDSANTVRAEGGDVRAVTVWAAFGSTDWNSLVTVPAGHYEPGLWDVRAPQPRPTAIATMARQLARRGRAEHPLLHGPGWWDRDDRHHFPIDAPRHARQVRGRPILITGATGTLGRAFARVCVVRGIPYRLLRRQEMDIGSIDSVRDAFDRWRPWAVINTAGYVRVDDAEFDERQWRENALGPVVLAQACAERGAKLVTFSSDLVFGGEQHERPYVESDEPRPLNAYGRAKRHAEHGVLDACASALVLRTAAFFGPWDEHNFATHCLQVLRRGDVFRAAADQVVSPTYVPHLVEHALDLMIDDECGLWHLANRGAVSWAEFAQRIAQASGVEGSRIEATPGALLGQCAHRPAYAALGSERGWPMPTLDAAIAHYVRDCANPVHSAHVDVLTDHGLHHLEHEVVDEVEVPPPVPAAIDGRARVASERHEEAPVVR